MKIAYFIGGAVNAYGLLDTTGKQRLAAWLFSPFHALHDAFQTAFFAPPQVAYEEREEEVNDAHDTAITEWENQVNPTLNPAVDAVFQAMGPGWDDSADTVKDDIKTYLLGQRPSYDCDRPYQAYNSATFEAFLRLWGRTENEGTPQECRISIFGTKPAAQGQSEPDRDIAPVLAVFNAQRTIVQAANLSAKPVKDSLPEKPNAAWLRYGIGATALTSISQGTATYAAIFGLGLICNAYIGGLAGTITHGIAAGIVGMWFGSGRGKSGLVSGLLIGGGVFALQTYGLTVLSELLGLSELHMHLVAGAGTIMATFVIESIAQVTTRQWENETSDPEYTSITNEYSNRVNYKTEHYMLNYLSVKVNKLCGEGGRCRGGNQQHTELKDERD